MQTSQQQPIIKKKDDKVVKLPQRPVSASAARSDYNFRFNSKIRMPKKNSPLEVPHIYHTNFGITNPYLLSISNLKKLNINNYGNINIEKLYDKATISANNFFASPKGLNIDNYPNNKMINNSMSNHNNNYPSLLLSNNTNQNKLNLNLNKFNVVKEGKNIEKEKLYDDNIKLKEKINQLNKEMINLKSEIHKKDMEITKINKLISEYIGEGKINLNENNNENNLILNNLNLNNFNANGNSQTNKLYEKTNNHQLIYNLKKQYKELKNQLVDKTTELETIKKTIKNTKIIELKVENQTFAEEIKNMNIKIENYIERIKNFENMQGEYFIILENFKKQTAVINQLREENTTYSQDIKDLSDKLNSQISKHEILKELEKKNKKIEELETELRIRKAATHPDEFINKNDLLKEIVLKLRDPKFLIDSQTNKQIALNSFFKSKIDIYMIELEKLDNENKKLREYVYFLENQSSSVNNNNDNKKQDNFISEKMNSNMNKNYADLPSTIELADSKRNNQSSSISTPNTYLNEDQLKYFTYVLIKNFEVKKVDCNYLKETIFGEDVSKMSIEELAIYLENHILNLLKITNINDKNNVAIYTRSIIRYNKNDYLELKNSFLSFFEIIKVYTDREESKLKNKLIKKFKNHKNDIITSIEYFDPNKTGIITFLTFKQVLQNINIRMSEKYTEYLIYLMKKEKEDKISLNLEELRYLNVLEILDVENENILNEISSSLDENDLNNPDENDDGLEDINLAGEIDLNEEENEKSNVYNNNNAKNNIQSGNEENYHKENQHDNKNAGAVLSNEPSSKNTLNQAVINSTEKKNVQENQSNNQKNNNEIQQDIEEEEEEVIITIEQFNERVDKILSKLAEYLLSNKKTVKEFFCNYISIHNVTTYDYYDAITLKDFIQILQNIGVTLDTIDIYCIFTKLKYNDDFETIDVSKLLDEMLNYGIFEDNFKGFCNPILENQEENKEITENSLQEKKVNYSANNKDNDKYNFINNSNNKNKDSQSANSGNNMNLISINQDLQNEFLISLNNHLKMKNLSFDEFIAPKIHLIRILNDGNRISKLIKYEEFMKYCKDTKVITDKNFELDQKMKDLLCENDNHIIYINIQKVSNCLDKMEKEFGDFEYEGPENNYDNQDNEDIENESNKDEEEKENKKIEINKDLMDEDENYEADFDNFIENDNDEENFTNKTSKVTDNVKNEVNTTRKNKSESNSKYSLNELSVKNTSNKDESKFSKYSAYNNNKTKDEELKKQIEQHQRSLNSSLDLDNIEDMDVEGLD